MFKKYNLLIMLLSAFFLLNISLLAEIPNLILFQIKLATQSEGDLEGLHDVMIKIVDQENPTEMDGGIVKWSENKVGVYFEQGVATIILGDKPKNRIKAEHFNIQNPWFYIQVDNDESLSRYIPVPSVPYSMFSSLSKETLKIDASAIQGEFTSTLNLKGGLRITGNILEVDVTTNRIGILRTPNIEEDYVIDISGNINAKGFYVEGKPLEETLHWKRNSENDLFFLGKVGIGVVSPSVALDVSGSINANRYLINQKDLREYFNSELLLWKENSEKNVVYFLGKDQEEYQSYVSIGTQDIKAQLTVDGGILIGKSLQEKAGTLEFDKELNHFYGFIEDGVKMPLDGVQVSNNPSENQLAIWDVINDQPVLKSSEKLTFEDDRLGVGGTSNALLTIKGSEGHLLHVENAQGKVALLVASNNVTIGTDNIQEDYELDVHGYINASQYFLNGTTLNQALSNTSVWTKSYFSTGEGAHLYYDDGSVGIGTSEPTELLSLKSEEKNVGIVFEAGDKSLFSIGINKNSPNAFAIASGGDLQNTLFALKKDESGMGANFGIGVNPPKFNLHISGNLGLLIEGSTSNVNMGITGNGTRMLFFTGKNAFYSGTSTDESWGDAFIGEDSVAIGLDVVASGKGAVVLGGENNRATGQKAVVLGGSDNEASGDYSFAAGYKAKATHHGSFVWSDYTPPTEQSTPQISGAFESSQSNQFLIRANHGVGINTNDTTDTVLTVAGISANSTMKYLLKIVGNSGRDDEKVVVTNEGKVGIGTMNPKGSLSVMTGNVGIGENDPQAKLVVKSLDQSQDLLQVGSGATPILIVKSSGYIGVATSNPNHELTVSGSVFATDFLFPNHQGGVSALSSFRLWMVNNNDIFRNRGKVGIGTRTPNTLLELSNQNVSGNLPVISFDLVDDGNNQKGFSMGVITVNNKMFFTIQPSKSIAANQTGLIITTRNQTEFGIGIGIGFETPSADFHVSGNVFISGSHGHLFVGNNVNESSQADKDTYDVIIKGKTWIDELYISGNKFVIPEVSPWHERTLPSGETLIYVTQNATNQVKVGIGLITPSVALEVNGAIKTHELIVATNNFEFQGLLKANKLLFVNNAGVVTGALYINSSNEFGYEENYPGGIFKELGKTIQRSDASGSGPLGYWVDKSTLGRLPLYWDNLNNILEVTGSIIVNNVSEKVDQSTLSISRLTHNIEIGSTVTKTLLINSQLSHFGADTSNFDYINTHLDIDLNQSWGNRKTIKGLAVNLAHENENLTLYNGSTAVGLFVDVTSINISENPSVPSSNKFAAIFNGGNVGIGTREPSALLHVEGTISANRLQSSELNFNVLETLALFVDTKSSPKRVGINTKTPAYTLDVSGTIKANELIVDTSINAVSLNIGNGNFIINSSGNIGIGKAPQHFFDIEKTITAADSRLVVIENIDVEVDLVDTPQSGAEYYAILERNITGLDIQFKTAEGTALNTNTVAKGLNIDLGNVSQNADGKVIGLHVKMPDSQTGKRYAAIFQGGNVGIGTDAPSARLDVSGDIQANNLIVSGRLDVQSTMNIGNLIVEGIASLNRVSINQLTVSGSTVVGILKVKNEITVPTATVTTLSVLKKAEIENASINGLLTVPTISSNRLEVLERLSVNQMVIDQLSINQMMMIEDQASVRFGVDKFVLNTDGRVGIGTANPSSNLHIKYTQAVSEFNASDTSTWQPITIQSADPAEGHAVGLLLIPSAAIGTDTGSGIVAIKKGSGSELAFITDADDALPAERMRINGLGYVGIGTTAPTALFHVNGETKLEGDVTINGRLNVGRIESEALTINVGTLDIIGLVSINSTLNIQTMVFNPQSFANRLQPGKPLLMVDEEGDLIFVSSNNTTSINITQAFTGDPLTIPFFDENRNLKESDLYWIEGEKTLQIGTSNQTAFLNINSSLSSGTPTSAIDLNVNVNTPGSEVNGLSIKVSTNELAASESVVGLKIDMTQATSSGEKLAAMFKGGSVGIGPMSLVPSASLHIKQVANTEDILLLQTETETAFKVDGLGRVGIGTDDLEARFTIKQKAGEAIMIVTGDNQAEPVLLVTGNQVGIMTRDLSSGAALVVGGIVSANEVSVNELKATSMNINNQVYITREGYMMIGTINKLAELLVTPNITVFKHLNSNSPYIGEVINIHLDFEEQLRDESGNVISGGDTTLERNYTHPLIGESIIIKSSPGNQITNTAVGLSINMTEIGQINTNAKVTGLDIDVTGTTGKRYAAIFQGGNVGIGTDAPSAALHVSGNMRIEGGLTVEGQITVNRLAVELLTVTGNSPILKILGDQPLTINTLGLSVVSVNTLNILDAAIINGTGQLAVSTVNAGIISANQLWIGSGKVLTEVNPFALFVSGNMKINNGSFDVDELTVGTINAMAGTSIITVNASVLVSGNVSVNQLTVEQLVFSPQSELHSGLYMNQNNALMYNQTNLSELYQGTIGAIPFYTATGLTSNANLTWDDSLNQLNIGQESNTGHPASLKIIALASSNQDIDFSAQTIQMRVSRDLLSQSDIAGFSTTFKGLNIEFKSASDSFLAAGEKAFGLYVDMSDLDVDYSTTGFGTNDLDIKARKYAAVFSGGFVGINEEAPEAALHIKASESLGNAILRIEDQNSNVPSLFVSGNSVGIGTEDLTGRLTIKSTILGQTLLDVKNERRSILIVKDDQVGIGVTQGAFISDAALIVSGNVLFKFKDTQSDEPVLRIKNGKVAINTNLEDNAQFLTDGSFRVDTDDQAYALYVHDNANVGIKTNNPIFPLTIQTTENQGILAIVATTNITSLPALITRSKGGVLIASENNVFSFFGLDGTDSNSVLAWKNPENKIFKFGHVNENNSMTSVLELNPSTNTVIINGAGTSAIAALHVSGSMKVDLNNVQAGGSQSSNSNVFQVSPEGYVSIKGGPEKGRQSARSEGEVTASLTVHGTIVADQIEAREDTIYLSYASFSEGLEIQKDIFQSSEFADPPGLQSDTIFGQKIRMNLGYDTSKGPLGSAGEIKGLDISLTSVDLSQSPDQGLDTNIRNDYFLVGNATAIGLKVDMENIGVHEDSVDSVKIYSGLFLGAPLYVNPKDSEVALPQNQNQASALTLYLGSHTEVDEEAKMMRMGSDIVKFNIDMHREYESVLFKVGKVSSTENDTALSIYKNGVGINTIAHESIGVNLLINGDARIGTVKPNNPAALEPNKNSWGNKLYFSGIHEDNYSKHDEVFISRLSQRQSGQYSSGLVVNLGQQETRAKRFVVQTNINDSGTAADSQFSEVFIVQSSIYENSDGSSHVDGRVGISASPEEGENFIPSASLHVRGKKYGFENTGVGLQPSDFLVLFENKGVRSEHSSHTLGILHRGESQNMANANFIQFLSKDQEENPIILGEIEQNNGINGEVGVRFKTAGGDYAEYLEKQDPSEQIEKADVVGVFNGKISKKTKGAQHVMVLSTSAAVAGNWPGEDTRNYALVAFFGQVKVKVSGPVKKGDYIVASGKNDGVGIAISKHNMKMTYADKIVGRAWESSNKKEIKKVLCAVGLEFSRVPMKKQFENISVLENKLKNLQNSNKVLEKKLLNKMQEQDKRLKNLERLIKDL